MACFSVLFLLVSILMSQFWLPNRGGHEEDLCLLCLDIGRTGKSPVSPAARMCEAGCLLAEFRYDLLISPAFCRLSSSSPPSGFCLFFFSFFFSGLGSYYLALNSRSPCFGLPRAGVTGSCYHSTPLRAQTLPPLQ